MQQKISAISRLVLPTSNAPTDFLGGFRLEADIWEWRNSLLPKSGFVLGLSADRRWRTTSLARLVPVQQQHRFRTTSPDRTK